MKTLTKITLVVAPLMAVACASNSSKVNSDNLSAIGAAGNGGFIFHVKSTPTKPCHNFKVWFSDTNSGNTASAQSYHGFINVAKPTDIVGAKPGKYHPVRATCNSIEHDGNYKKTYNSDFKINSPLLKPITVEAGKVTVINSLNFKSYRRGLAIVFVDETESSKIKKIKSKNDQYTFVEN